DGIRYPLVTGVQTCALPIYPRAHVVDLLPDDREGGLGGARVSRPLAGGSAEERGQEQGVPAPLAQADRRHFHRYTMENTKTQTTSTKCQYQEAALKGKCCCGVICPRSTEP